MKSLRQINLRLLLIFSVCLIAYVPSFAQAFDWVKSFGGSNLDEGFAIDLDNAGNVYTTGYFRDTCDFDPGIGSSNHISAGLADVFIQKLNSAGDFVWARSFGGTLNDEGQSIAVDENGNVYTTGRFTGTVDFDPGAGSNIITSSGTFDYFVHKLDSSGNFEWVKTFGGTSSEGVSIALDSVGNVLTTGYFMGTVDFDPGPGTVSFTPSGFRDVFVHKLDSSGNFIWVKTFAGNSNARSNSVNVDNLGNIYTTGRFSGTVDFDPGSGTLNFTSSGVNDVFLHKMDPLGNLVWATSFGGSGGDEGNSVGVDGSGSVYTLGSFAGTVDFDPSVATVNRTSAGAQDIFLQKLDSSGQFIWVKTIGGTGFDRGNSLGVDTSNEVFITGSFSDTVDFDPGPGSDNRISAGSSDIYIIKVDSAGNPVWVNVFGSIGGDEGNGIALDIQGNVHTTGTFANTVDFNPGTGIQDLISNGSFEVFVQKLGDCQTTTHVDTITACDQYTWANGITYTTSSNGIVDTFINSIGCDSIVALSLNLLESSSSVDVVTACGSYTWINDSTYTASDTTATDTLTNSNGCDSVIALHLTILEPTLATDTITACDSFTWIDGNSYTSSDSTATDTLTNAAGCDSLVTLNLTIINSTSSIDSQAACNSYTWIDGNSYTESNSAATYTIVGGASNGCDSIVILDLTINSVSDISTTTDDAVITASNTNATYQWLDCNANYAAIPGETGQSFTAIENGDYAVEITESGCIDTSDCVTINTLGFSENSFGNVFKVFPNPTNGNLTIELGASYTFITVSMTDLSGRIIEESNFYNANLLSLEVTAPSGVYFLKVETAEQAGFIKLIKE